MDENLGLSPKPRMGTRSVWVNLGLFTEFTEEVKKQGTNTVADEIERLLHQRLAELRGLTPQDPGEKPEKMHERLSNRHMALSKQKAALEKLLLDSGSYERFMDVCRGILATRFNRDIDTFRDIKVESMIPGGSETDKFRETIRSIREAGNKNGDSEGAENFVRLMRLIMEQKTLQSQLRRLDLPSEV